MTRAWQILSVMAESRSVLDRINHQGDILKICFLATVLAIVPACFCKR